MTQLPTCIYSYEDALTRVQAPKFRGKDAIEPGIQPLIAAFVMFGVETYAACEGRRGDPAPFVYPWVDFPQDQYEHTGALLLAAGLGDWTWGQRPESPLYRLQPTDVSLPLEDMRAGANALAERIRSLAT